jgi:putative addiction module antidote
MKLKLKAIGRSTGVILPKEMLQRLDLKTGNFLFAVEVHGGYLLTRYDPKVAEQISLGLKFMKQYKGTLRGLASRAERMTSEPTR